MHFGRTVVEEKDQRNLFPWVEHPSDHKLVGSVGCSGQKIQLTFEADNRRVIPASFSASWTVVVSIKNEAKMSSFG